MKKLTKRVQAGGLWFDVPTCCRIITFDQDGAVSFISGNAEPVASDTFGKWVNTKSCLHWLNRGRVDLEGADWRECCWFVGDQVDGEDVEHREWMAEGIAAWIDSRQGRWNGTTKEAEYFAGKIRAGEIE